MMSISMPLSVRARSQTRNKPWIVPMRGGDGSCHTNVRLNGLIGFSKSRLCESATRDQVSMTGLTRLTLSRIVVTSAGPMRCSRLTAPGEWAIPPDPSARAYCRTTWARSRVRARQRRGGDCEPSRGVSAGWLGRPTFEGANCRGDEHGCANECEVRPNAKVAHGGLCNGIAAALEDPT